MLGPVLTRLVAGKLRRNGKAHLKGQFSMSKLSNLTTLQVCRPRSGNGAIDFHFFILPSDTFIKVGSYPGFSSFFIDHSEAD